MINAYTSLASDIATEILEDCDRGITTARQLYDTTCRLADYQEYAGMLEAYDHEVSWRAMKLGFFLRRSITTAAVDLLWP